MIIRERILGYN